MRILSTNIDTNDKKAVYKLTKKEAQRIQDLDKGVSLTVDAFALYEEDKTRTKKDGTTEDYVETVLTIVSGGLKVATISPTFIKSFMEIVELMAGEPFSIIITGGTSKGGRDYVNCELDCD